MKLFVFWFLLFLFSGSLKAQTISRLRTVNYTTDLIYGLAPAGAVIKLYYAEAGSFSPNNLVPIASVVTEADGVWFYSRSYNGLSIFQEPVVVSMTGSDGAETFESPVLAPDEIIEVNPRPCSELHTLGMSPSVADLFSWRNRNGSIVSQDKLLREVPGGIYTLEYTNIGGRTYKSAEIVLETPPQALPADIQLQCDENFKDYIGVYNGSGSDFLWEDRDNGNIIGRSQAVRLFPGSYNFYVISPSGCRSAPAIVTVAPASALATVDLSGQEVKPTACNQAMGSITGIKAFAAGNFNPSYRWRDTKGQIYNGIDVYNLPADEYVLEAYLAGRSCPTVLTTVEILEENAIQIDVSRAESTSSSCGLSNGSVSNLSTNATIVKWYRGEDRMTPVSTMLELTDAAPDYYTLVLENEFGCRIERVFHIPEGSPAIKLLVSPVIKNDICNLSKGSISGARFNTSVNYTWLNGAGQVVAANSDLLEVPAGTYTLLAKSDRCENSFEFTVGSDVSVLEAPLMKDFQICSASKVNVHFQEEAMQYRIYAPNGALLAQSGSKDFSVLFDAPGTYYAALASGSCESPRAAFQVAFGASGLTIPSAFSPNDDGINDQWIIRGLDVYMNPEVKVFNREGQMVFRNEGISAIFDGKWKGTDLPTGTYYFVIKTGGECPLETGSLMLIR